MPRQINLAIPIPETFQGRPVTNRGVHMQPNGQWGAFMDSADEWVQRLLDMHISWVVALTDSDSFVLQGAAKVLLDAGIIPIVRFNPSNLPRPYTQMAATEQLVALYSRYNVPCIIAWLNECGNSREWALHKVPPDWFDVWIDNWRNAARQIIERGAICAIPDGPVYPRSPFPQLVQGLEAQFEGGWVAYKGHYYGLNRPPDWPYDAAQRLGVPLSWDGYFASLDDFKDDPNWWDPPLDVLNEFRRSQANPTLTAVEDATCWMGWQQTEFWMERDLGFHIPHFMGEGGWTPKARAGSGENAEKRYTLPTPKKVAERTLLMYQWNDLPDVPARHHLFAFCPWIVAVDALGAIGWYDDCWFGGAYYDKYGFAKPVVQALIDNPPGPEPPEPPDDCPSEETVSLARGTQADLSSAMSRVQQITALFD